MNTRTDQLLRDQLEMKPMAPLGDNGEFQLLLIFVVG